MEDKYIPWEPHIETVIRADIDKYITRLLKQEPALKEDVRLNKFESTCLYRISAGDVFFKHAFYSCFSGATFYIIDSFPLWRKHSFERAVAFGRWKYADTIWPPDEIREREIDRVCKKINHFYAQQIGCLINEQYTEKYYEMARLIGEIDYLRSLPTCIEYAHHKIGKKGTMEDVLTDAGRSILAQIKAHYWGQKPKQLVIMLSALLKGGYIEPDLWDKDDKAAIRRMLLGAFGGSWSPTAINNQLVAYNDPNDQQKREIEVEKRRINAFVKG